MVVGYFSAWVSVSVALGLKLIELIEKATSKERKKEKKNEKNLRNFTVLGTIVEHFAPRIQDLIFLWYKKYDIRNFFCN